MSLSAMLTVGPATFGAGPTTVPVIRDFGLNFGVEDVMEGDAGSPYNTFAGAMQVNPVVNFASLGLKAALDLFGVAPYSVANANPAYFYLQAMEQKGLRQSGSTHRRVVVHDAMIVPTRLTLTQDQPARIEFDCHVRWDGSNGPLSFGSGVALPAESDVDSLWTLGPVNVDGSAVTGVKSVSVDFGFQVLKERSDGDALPTFIAIGQHTPRITVETLAPYNVGTLGQNGDGGDSTTCVVYAQKMARYGTRVAAATEEHISLTVNHWRARPMSVNATHVQGASSGFEIEVLKKSATALIVLDTTAAIA